MMWRLGVVGFPIEHSLSPTLHAAGLVQADLQGTSQAIAMRDEPGEGLRELLGLSFDALSVTMPLKRRAHDLCDVRDAYATRTGVVNSLLVRDGQVLGACTDGLGFVDAVRAQFAVSPEGMNVVVLGTGGAARAIVDALVAARVQSVALHARSAPAVADLSALYPNVYDHSHRPAVVDLVVNTLPVHARLEGAPAPHYDEGTFAVDVTYEPRQSAWLAACVAQGCRGVNGLGMLAFQAARQMSWWWRQEISGDRLLEVVL